MCENIPAYIKCCLKSALTLTMIPLHRYLQQFVMYCACTAKDRCLCVSPALTHLLFCVSTVLRGALRLQHEPHKEPSTRQRTNQVSVVLSLCFFCFLMIFCVEDVVQQLYMHSLYFKKKTVKSELRGGERGSCSAWGSVQYGGIAATLHDS